MSTLTQVAAHHLSAQRRSAGGKSAISENQPLGRPHRRTPPPTARTPHLPSSGAKSATSACDASCQTPPKMRHNFSFFPRNRHKQMDFENAQNLSPLPANMRHNRPTGPMLTLRRGHASLPWQLPPNPPLRPTPCHPSETRIAKPKPIYNPNRINNNWVRSFILPRAKTHSRETLPDPLTGPMPRASFQPLPQNAIDWRST